MRASCALAATVLTTIVVSLVPVLPVAGAQTTVSVTGTVRAIAKIGESFSTAYYLVRTDGPRLDLVDGAVPASVAAPFVGSEIEATGVLTDRSLAVASVRPLGKPRGAATESSEMTALTGNRPTTIYLLHFAYPGYPQPFTPAEAEARVLTNSDSTAAFISAQSSGTTSLSGYAQDFNLPAYWTDPFGNVIDLNPSQPCDTVASNIVYYMSYLLAYSTTRHDLLVMPPLSGCSFSGFGEQPGNISFYNGALTTRLTGHELGHNLGFAHASSLDCNAPNVIGPFCTPLEYGDEFDVMGSGACAYNAWNRNLIAWPIYTHSLSASGTKPQAFTVRASDLSSNGTQQALRFFGGYPQWGDKYVFEWHTRAFPGCAAHEPANQGMLVRALDGLEMNTYLLDMRPATATFADAPMQVGDVFVDPTSAMRVRLDSLDPVSGNAVLTAGSFGFAEVVGSEIRYTARPGDTNNIVVEHINDGASEPDIDVMITDLNGHQVNAFSGNGCTKSGLPANQAKCRATGAVFATVHVGDGHDRVESRNGPVTGSPFAIPMQVFGSFGNDTLVETQSNPGPVEFHGGDGSDLVDYATRTQFVNVSLDHVANDGQTGEGDNILSDVENITGGRQSDFLNGSAAANLIIGGAGHDTFNAGGGNDVVLAGDGDDLVHGDDGNDSLFGETGADGIYGGTGNDALDGGLGSDPVLNGQAGTDQANYASRTGDLVLTLDGNQNDGDPSIGEADNLLEIETVVGGSGYDVIAGTNTTTPDVLIGNAGGDVIFAGTGDDIVVGGPGDDTLLGQDGNDWIPDSLFGSPSGGNDYIDAGSGNDDIEGGAGNDRLLGKAGNDIVKASDSAADQQVDCGSGTDTATYDPGLDNPIGCES